MDKTIIIPNPKELDKKKDLIRKQEIDKFHVISDFDKTLTKAFAKGNYVLSIIAYLRNKKYLTEDYAPRAHALFDKYHPIEISLNVSKEEKKKAMYEWWKSHFELLIECGLNKATIQKAAKEMFKEKDILFREGTIDFIKLLYKYHIPLVIMSASVGDIIQELLKQNNCYYNNIHIIANLLDFDKNGEVTGLTSTIIHSMNKKEIEIKKFPVYKELEKRRNVLLLGDSLDDIDMIKGFSYENLIKIGFLNEKEDEFLEKYKENFDIIILKDSSMNPIIELIKELIK